MDLTPKSIRCKAAVNRVAGEPMQIEDVIVAPPKAHEVRIKIICTSLCHSDVILWRMKDFPAVQPQILGHEAVGEVESVGEGVTEFNVGDIVLPVLLSNCTECWKCKSEKTNLCLNLPFFRPTIDMPRDATSRFAAADTGEELHHFFNVSSFSEYTVVDVGNLVKVHPSMPPEKACLLSCGVTSGLGAAWKTADVEAGSTVAVFGLGAIGLAVAEGARLRGAGRIIGVDTNPAKFDIGKKFGITDFINPKELGDKSTSEVIKEMTGEGADYCFECVGLASVMSDAFLSSASWGKTVILGVEMNRSPFSVNTYEILQGKTIIGSFLGGVKTKTDLPKFMDLYINKELNLDDFITHEVGFEDINKAFDLLIKGKSIRCIIWMDK